MITLKTAKVISPVCDVKNSNGAFSSVGGKLTTLGLFFIENNDWMKMMIVVG